ncbi:hypothetical protein ACFXG4_37895 [Nocardia sp. NPDC059246]|uniref:hypothetical protein n=1 Tax=unclassified Nocardia TaxID=2637762 RepID=UPI0036C972EE
MHAADPAAAALMLVVSVLGWSRNRLLRNNTHPATAYLIAFTSAATTLTATACAGSAVTPP